jgi:CRP-like cAMP-binding protein
MTTPRNLLLAALPTESLDRLSPHLKTIDLPHGKILHRPNDAIEEVYFPLNCLISVTVTMTDGNTSEAGVVGNREMVGINAFMGGRETNQTEYVAQVTGLAVRMPADLLLGEFDRSKPFRDVMLRYTQAYIAQLSQNVACNRQHDINQRLARWLLESCDRIQSDDIPLTHDFIGQMLGVRRAGVGEGLAILQAKGLVDSGRKSIKITDLAGLKGAACECYEVIRDEYDRLLGIRKA